MLKLVKLRSFKRIRRKPMLNWASELANSAVSTFFYLWSNNNNKKKPTKSMNSHQKTQEYIKGKSPFFIIEK